MRDPTRALFVVFGGTLVAILSVLDASVVRAQGAGAVVPLPTQMAAVAQQYLPGVVGEPVPAFTIDPALASLAAGARDYEIVSGTEAGRSEQHVIAALPRDATGTRWRYTIANRTLFLQAVPGESVSITSEEDSDQGVLTRYNPPEPLLIAGMNAGDTRKGTINVKVYDLNDPEDLEHKGTVNLTFTYVGAYKVTVPAGTFDAALLRWDYKGKVGPASIEDIQVRFVAPDVGMVAMADKRDIAAMLVYNDHSKVGKVLQQRWAGFLEKLPGYTFLRGLAKRLTGGSEGHTLEPALAEIEDALVPAFIVEELERRHAN